MKIKELKIENYLEGSIEILEKTDQYVFVKGTNNSRSYYCVGYENLDEEVQFAGASDSFFKGFPTEESSIDHIRKSIPKTFKKNKIKFGPILKNFVS